MFVLLCLFIAVPSLQTFNNTNRYLQLQHDLPMLNFSALGNIRNLSTDIVCLSVYFD